MLHKQIIDMLHWKKLIKNNKEYKKNGSHYLMRKGLKVYAFSRYPMKEDWDKKSWVYIADKEKVTMTPKNLSTTWQSKRMLANLAGGSWRISFKNHWIRFDELVEDSNGWRQQCPDYYIYDNGNKEDKDKKNEKIPVFGGMVLAYDGKCLNLDSKQGMEKQKLLDKYLNLMRLRTNRMAKTRRLEHKAIAAARNAELTNDWSDVDPSDTFKIRNVSTRRRYLSHFSVEEIVKSMKPEVLDKSNLNNTEYELLKFEIDPVEGDMAYYLKMLNPSTGEIHFEGVGPYGDSRSDGIEAETVEAALMWRDSEKMYEGDGDQKVKIDYNTPIAIT